MNWFKEVSKESLRLAILIFACFHAGAISANSTQSDVGEIPSLAAVSVSGNSALSIDQIFDAYKNLLGEGVNRILLEELELVIIEHYLSRGYFAPNVNITTHHAIDSVLEVSIREAKLGRFSVQPRTGELADKLRGVLVGYELSRHLQKSELNTLKKKLEAVEGANVKVEFVRREDQENIYDLLVLARPNYEMELGYSNEGGQLLGPELADVAVGVNGVAGTDVDVKLSHVRTDSSDAFEQTGIYLNYANSMRSIFSLSYLNSDSLDIVSSTANVAYDTDSWSMAYRYSPLLSTRRQLDFGVAMYRRDHERTFMGALDFEQVVNSAQLSMRYNYFGTRLSSSLLLSATQGIDSFGAKEQDNSFISIPSDLDFKKANIRLKGWFVLPLKLTAKIDIAAQYSDSQLPSSQLFTLGGSALVRAYEPGELFGESGIGGNVEIRKRIKFNGQSVLTPYAYYGLGRASYDLLGETFESSASAAGLGLRFRHNGLSTYAEADRPLTRSSIYKDRDTRLNAGIRVRI